MVIDLENIADSRPRSNVVRPPLPKFNPSVSLHLTARLEKRSDILDAGIGRRIRNLERDIAKARVQAAKIATAVSKQKLKRTRPVAPGRPGRDNEHIEDVLLWRAGPKGVTLNSQELNKRAGHWTIQEIGTNRSANIYINQERVAVRKIPTQRGRRIPSSLVFATGPGGKFVAPGAGSNQQLYLRSKVQKAPTVRRHVRTSDDIGSRRPNSIRIRREIPGQHFVRDGGKAGFLQYRKSVLAAARTQFRRELG